MTNTRRCVLTVLLLSAALARTIPAQTTGYSPLRADGNGVPALVRTIALDVRDATLREALRTIAREADLELIVRADLPGLDRRVTLRESRVTAAVALLRVLERSGLQPLVSAAGQIVVVEPPRREPSETGIITGTVSDAVTGMPIDRAEVALTGGGRAVTDAGGQFRVRGVAPGAVTVIVRRLGYHDGSQEIVVRSGEETSIALAMATAPTPLAAVIVTPGHFGMLDQGISSRQTLTREQIQTAPQLGDDIFRAVNRLPGVSSHDMSAAFGVRGGEHREVLVRLDGLELLEPFHLKDLESSLSIIDIGAVGGIDLITGGFGAEYGNRTAGVFDMRTLDVPPAGTRTSLGLSLTNVRAASQGSFAADRGRWLFTVRRGYLDLAIRLSNLNTSISPTYYDMLGKVEYEITPNTVLSAHVLHAGDRLTYDDKPEDPVLNSAYGSSYAWLNLATEPHERLRILTVLAAGRLGWERHGIRDPDRQARWTAFDVDDERSYRFTGLRQDWSLELEPRLLLKAGFDARRASAQYDYQSWLQRFSVTAGRVEASYDTTRLGAHPNGTSVGAYVAQRVRPWQPLTVEFGAEYARHTHTGDSNINPRLNAAVALGRTTLRAAWGRYAQAQGLHELQVQDGVDQFFPADVALHRIVSIERAFAPGLNVRIEGYQRDVRDPRPRFANLDATDDPFPEVSGSRALIDPTRARAQGVELAARWTGARFDGAASYALSQMRERIGDEWKPGPRDQPHAFGIDLMYAPNARWRMAAAWQIHTGWPMTPRFVRADSLAGGGYYFTRYDGEYNAQRVPAYHRMDLRVSRHFDTARGRVVVFADVWNVYDRGNARTILANINGVRDGQPITVSVLDTMIPRLPSVGVHWEF